jgi:hypothetical protein
MNDYDAIVIVIRSGAADSTLVHRLVTAGNTGA